VVRIGKYQWSETMNIIIGLLLITCIREIKQVVIEVEHEALYTKEIYAPPPPRWDYWDLVGQSDHVTSFWVSTMVSQPLRLRSPGHMSAVVICLVPRLALRVR
jgi:hypothetical protein